ncbi:antichymotrypsin-2-like [Penaeus vannamei]|uniref:antichymotrypsin-2-like n=1 Tax=Penaeus vannamei TaxID=6689 RepID=UPI00387FA106
MRTLELIAVLALRAGMSVVHPQCISSNDSYPVPTFIDLDKYLSFNVKLFAEVLPEEGNFVFSPYTVWRNLLLIYLGSEGRTLKELESALPSFSKVEALTVFRATAMMYQVPGALEAHFTTSNRLYLDEDLHIRDCVLDFLKESIMQVEFDKPHIAAKHINSAIEEDTEGKVRETVLTDDLHDNQAVLVTAAYFKSVWEQPFLRENTALGKFFTKNDAYLTVNMMHHVGHFRKTHSQSLAASILELPFLGDTASMFIVLPDKKDIDNDLYYVLQNLEPLTKSVFFVAAKPRTRVSVTMPKFTMESTVMERLKKTLGRLKIEDLFSKNANLSAFIDEDFGEDGETGPKYEKEKGGGTGEARRDGGSAAGVGKSAAVRVNAIEKAVVEVDEQGLSPDRGGDPNPALRVIHHTRLFECVRPFAYFIVGNRNKAILFMGVYRGPMEG